LGLDLSSSGSVILRTYGLTVYVLTILNKDQLKFPVYKPIDEKHIY